MSGFPSPTERLLLAIENTFQIRLSYDEAHPLTLGDLCETVFSKVKGRESTECLNRVTFCMVRHGLAKVTGVDRYSVTPSTILKNLVSSGPERQRQWRRLELEAGLKIPSLTVPGPVSIGILLVSLCVAMALTFREGTFPLLLSIPLSFMVSGLAFMLLQPRGWAIPPNCETVGGLTDAVLAKNFANASGEAGGWNENDIWKVLRVLIEEETGLEGEKVKKETLFPVA